MKLFILNYESTSYSAMGQIVVLANNLIEAGRIARKQFREHDDIWFDVRHIELDLSEAKTVTTIEQGNK